ncbi:hypothetical protein TNCV_731061 [Trichonephila clavipes]|nr:hypothetical protein TNCV_731061 [Trichonephila clavipes]
MKGLSSREKGSTDVCADGEGAGGRPKGFFSSRRWVKPQDVSVSGTFSYFETQKKVDCENRAGQLTFFRLKARFQLIVFVKRIVVPLKCPLNDFTSSVKVRCLTPKSLQERRDSFYVCFNGNNVARICRVSC